MPNTWVGEYLLSLSRYKIILTMSICEDDNPTPTRSITYHHHRNIIPLLHPKRALENTVGKKRENTVNQYFPPFSTMFPSLSKTEIIIITTCDLSSAKLMLRKAEILSFDNGLKFEKRMQICRPAALLSV